MIRIFCYIVFAVLCYSTLPAYAQQDTALNQLEDMGQFYSECQADPRYNSAFDCRCLSVSFYDAIKGAGKYERNSIIQNLNFAACPRTIETDMKDGVRSIPTEYLEEAEAFNQRCQTTQAYATHHDCDCLSTKYLDERVAQGRFSNPSLIELKISKTCQSQDAAAGYSYGVCMQQSASFPSGQNPELYCECVANTYARLFVVSGETYSSQSKTRFQTQAAIQCRRR